MLLLLVLVLCCEVAKGAPSVSPESVTDQLAHRWELDHRLDFPLTGRSLSSRGTSSRISSFTTGSTTLAPSSSFKSWFPLSDDESLDHANDDDAILPFEHLPDLVQSQVYNTLSCSNDHRQFIASSRALRAVGSASAHIKPRFHLPAGYSIQSALSCIRDGQRDCIHYWLTDRINSFSPRQRMSLAYGFLAHARLTDSLLLNRTVLLMREFYPFLALRLTEAQRSAFVERVSFVVHKLPNSDPQTSSPSVRQDLISFLSSISVDFASSEDKPEFIREAAEIYITRAQLVFRAVTNIVRSNMNITTALPRFPFPVRGEPETYHLKASRGFLLVDFNSPSQVDGHASTDLISYLIVHQEEKMIPFLLEQGICLARNGMQYIRRIVSRSGRKSAKGTWSTAKLLFDNGLSKLKVLEDAILARNDFILAFLSRNGVADSKAELLTACVLSPSCGDKHINLLIKKQRYSPRLLYGVKQSMSEELERQSPGLGITLSLLRRMTTLDKLISSAMQPSFNSQFISFTDSNDNFIKASRKSSL